MTKYTVASRRRAINAAPEINPIWRGIGCVMMIVIPVISFLLALFTVNLAIGMNWPVPYQLMGYPVMPTLLMKSAALLPIMLFIEGQQNLYAVLLLTVLYIVAIGALVSVVYSVIYRAGHDPYGPLDMPPERMKLKRYKR